MKITKIAFALSLAAALALTSCASNKSPVTRVDSETVLDLSGNWNDTDIGIVCKSLIAEASNSPRIAKFEAENGRPPVVILGRIRNDSSEPAGRYSHRHHCKEDGKCAGELWCVRFCG